MLSRWSSNSRTNQWARSSILSHCSSIVRVVKEIRTSAPSSPHSNSFVDFSSHGSVANFYQKSSWHEPSKQQENQPEEKHLVNSWQPKPLERVHQQLEEWRNLTGTDPVQWPWEKSEDTKSPRNCSSGSCPSSVSSVRLLKTSRPTCDSRAQLWWHFKRHPRPTWLDSSRTPTCAPSMPNVSPSCPRTSNSPGGSVERELKSLAHTQASSLATLKSCLTNKRFF